MKIALWKYWASENALLSSRSTTRASCPFRKNRIIFMVL